MPQQNGRCIPHPSGRCSHPPIGTTVGERAIPPITRTILDSRPQCGAQLERSSEIEAGVHASHRLWEAVDVRGAMQQVLNLPRGQKSQVVGLGGELPRPGHEVLTEEVRETSASPLSVDKGKGLLEALGFTFCTVWWAVRGSDPGQACDTLLSTALT